MSTIAPWIALAIDWQDSEMFDGSTHGERLAWVCLLCHAKAQGRAGKVRFRDKKFAADYCLTAQAIDGMLTRATKCGAAIRQDDQITVVNWKAYQDPKARSQPPTNSKVTKKRRHFSKTSENDATHHPVPSTHHPPTSTKTPLPPILDTDSFRSAWEKWEQHRKEIRKKLTPTTIDEQLKMLETKGHDKAIATILYSIEKGWTGLFEPDTKHGGPNGRTIHRRT